MLTTLCKALRMSVNETITMSMGIANDSWFEIRIRRKKKGKRKYPPAIVKCPKVRRRALRVSRKRYE